MATPTLVATPSASNANSYCTVAEADTYHDEHLYADDWTGATTPTKTVALIMATRTLESNWDWAGWPTKSVDEGQVLAWPRNSLVDIDKISTLNENVIPDQIKWATAELARNLIVSNRTADSDVETQGITSISAGPISLAFKDTVKAKVMPDHVKALIPPWWGTQRGGAAVWNVLRG
jgi:hypothetical protein